MAAPTDAEKAAIARALGALGSPGADLGEKQDAFDLIGAIAKRDREAELDDEERG